MDIDWHRAGLEALARSPEVQRHLADRVGRDVRDRARQNASVISSRLADAIEVESGTDDDGAFADVGYDKRRPGFALWWHEVGTSRHPATPHLRPALQPGD